MTPAAPATSGLRERLGAFFAGEPSALVDPYPLYRETRETARVLDLGPMVVLTAYEDVKWALRSADVLGNRALVEGSRVDAARARLSADALDAFDEVIAFESHFPSRNDGEDHARLRRIAHRAFTPRRIASLEPSIRETAARLLDEMAHDEVVDGMHLASRLPLVVVTELLGIPEREIGLIHGWSTVLGSANASTEAAPLLAARGVLREFRAYVGGMIERNRGAPGATDLVATLMGAEEEERLSEIELTALFVQLLFAGHETTTNLLGTGLRDLLVHRDQWEMLVADPSRAGDAVEELMRFVSPTQFVSRLALRDVLVANVTVPAGTTVIPVLAAAHRDPAVFADPDRLDLDRRESRQHLGFGFGPHFCLGAALARLEAEVVLAEVARRFPEATLATTELEWGGGAMLRGLARLPLRLGPEQA